MFLILTQSVLATLFLLGGHVQKNRLFELIILPSAIFAEYCSKPHLELTISPQTETVEVNWDIEDWKKGDKISIYLGNVIDRPGTVIPATSITTDTNVGWKDTKIPMSVKSLDITGYKRKCLKVYAVYWSKKESIMACCLQTLPDWMSHYKDKLGGMRLVEMFIPGTHNSAAYRTDYSAWLFNKIKAMYLFNQDLTVHQQLVLGSRYIDVRVKRENNSPKFADKDWVLMHGEYRLYPAVEVVNDIIKFMKNTKHEVVVLDIHRTEGKFSDKDALEFAQYLEHHLGAISANPSHNLFWHSTLESFWGAKRRLIVAYNNMLMMNKQGFYMSPVYQVWVNAQSVGDLENKLRPVFERTSVNYNYDYNEYYDYTSKDMEMEASVKLNETSLVLYSAWAIMAELTLKGFNVVTSPTQSLRKAAAMINPWLNRWFRRFSWGQRICNIVAVDFLLGTGIVRAALDFSLMRAGRKECYSHDNYKDGYSQTIYKK